MPHLLEVADLCSRPLSDPANRLRKTRKKKSSAVPMFRSGHMSAICTRLGSKGKVGVQRGRKTAGCPSFLPTAVGTASSPPRGAARSRRPQTANPPAEVQRKILRPLGANTLSRCRKKSRPVRCVQLRKHSKAREKRYSFGYAISFIFACYQILWPFSKSRYLCSRYQPLACD